MNDSASLLTYADWARRNGYDDEAKQYMVLGYNQKKVEERAYKTSVATGTEKLRKTKEAVARVNAEIARQEEAGEVNPATQRLEINWFLLTLNRTSLMLWARPATTVLAMKAQRQSGYQCL